MIYSFDSQQKLKEKYGYFGQFSKIKIQEQV